MRLLPFFMTFVVAFFASGCGNASVELAKAKSAEARAKQAANNARQVELAISTYEQANVQAIADQPQVDVEKENPVESNDPVAGKPGENVSSLVHEDLDATAWVQTSAEYPSITLQTYRAAQTRLDAALADPDWTAFAAQQDKLTDENGKPLPPAVILDVDETVLDNSGFQAELIIKGGEYTPDIWHAWVEKRKARPIPGAKEFLDACRSAGVTTYLVTNREFKAEEATRKNLEDLELIPTDAPDIVLSKREKEDWTSDKTSRREFVAATHRILLMVGDDLNDFAYAGKNHTAASRRKIAAENNVLFGDKWFMLPNPNYGGWERSLYQFDDRLPREKKLESKHAGMWTSESVVEE